MKKNLITFIFFTLISQSNASQKDQVMVDVESIYNSSTFVNLIDIDPSIIQSVRYATEDNFTGQPLPGYLSFNIVMTLECANALAKVQKIVNTLGYDLVVYDAYRPQKAVDFFFNTWRHQPDDQSCRKNYYPTFAKQELFDNYYIGNPSSHSRGSTVDLTLIRKADLVTPLIIRKVKLLNGKSIAYLDDSTVDMGTSFDMFHSASHHGTDLITPEQAASRQILLNAMLACGFEQYDGEWWHYTLANEPHLNTYFDFNVDVLREEDDIYI